MARDKVLSLLNFVAGRGKGCERHRRESEKVYFGRDHLGATGFRENDFPMYVEQKIDFSFASAIPLFHSKFLQLPPRYHCCLHCTKHPSDVSTGQPRPHRCSYPSNFNLAEPSHQDSYLPNAASAKPTLNET